MNNILKDEMLAFEAQKERLLATASNRWVLIRGERVIGLYDTEHQAMTEGYRQFLDRPFLVKRIERVERVHFISSARPTV